MLTGKRMDIINTCTLPGVAYGNLAKKQQQEKFLFKNSTKQGKTNKQFAYKSWLVLTLENITVRCVSLPINQIG